MCLDTIDEITKTVTEGYKIFRVSEDGKLLPQYIERTLCDVDYYPKNEWFFDKNERTLETDKDYYKKYKTGFHFFLNKSDAINDAKWDDSHNWSKVYEVRKIIVCDVVCTGRVFEKKAGVARAIFITNEITTIGD